MGSFFGNLKTGSLKVAPKRGGTTQFEVLPGKWAPAAFAIFGTNLWARWGLLGLETVGFTPFKANTWRLLDLWSLWGYWALKKKGGNVNP